MKYLLLISLLWTLPAFAEFKVAYVDMQAALQATSAGKNAKSKLEKEFTKKHDALKNREDTLQKEAKSFEKTRLVMSEKKRVERQTELQKKFMAFKQDLNASQMEFQKKQREATLPIINRLKSVMSKVAKEKGFSMVVEKMENRVMWAQADLNITKDVVETFEKERQ